MFLGKTNVVAYEAFSSVTKKNVFVTFDHLVVRLHQAIDEKLARVLVQKLQNFFCFFIEGTNKLECLFVESLISQVEHLRHSL